MQSKCVRILKVLSTMSNEDLKREIEIQQKKFLQTILDLRKRNFSKGIPFLILSDKLPSGQSYNEFADGRIELVKLVKKNGEYETELVRVLGKKEADLVRKETGYFTKVNEKGQRKTRKM